MHTNIAFMLFIFILIGVIVLVSVWGVARYLDWASHYEFPSVSDSELPKAAIILSVRGDTPCLAKCLTSLVRQDYPRYQVHLIIDHPTDPACEVFQTWSAENPEASLEVSFLENPSRTAYLKTSAVLQCIRNLADDIDAVVIADADVVAYPRWLRDLVQPLMVDGIGIVSGNRWYDPTSRTWGEQTRFFYNALCVPPMYFTGATWSGSMAISRIVFDNDFFREAMTDTSSEDKAILASARKVELRHQTQPDVMIFNGEACSLGEAFCFIRRQLLWTRLYHPAWSIMLIGTWGVHLFLAGVLLTGLYRLLTGDISQGSLLLGALFLVMVAHQILAEWLHRSITKRARQVQGIDLPVIDWAARWRMIVALPVSFVVTCYAFLAAAVARRVTWSGITYEVIPPESLRLVEYYPLGEVPD